MKVLIELPRDWEVKEVTVDKGKITIVPRFGQGQRTTAPIAHIACEGEGGMQTKTMLLVSGTHGTVHLQRLIDSPKAVLFDLSPEDYEVERKGNQQMQAEAASDTAATSTQPTGQPQAE